MHYFTVLGWLDAKQEDGTIILNPSFTGPEDDGFYSLPIGFIKGSEVTVFDRPNIYYGKASKFVIYVFL